MEQPIPSAALAGMEDWAATVAWAFDPARVTWRFQAPGGETRFLKTAPLGWEPSLAAERDRMRWAAPWMPVPPVLGYGTDGGREWLLTGGLPGVDATDAALRADPPGLVPLLTAAVRRFHALPVDACPFDSRADTLVQEAEARVVACQVNPDADLHPDHGPLSAEGVLVRLRELRPEHEDLVVCHGDFCLPNVLLQDGQVTGYVDLGKLGVADRWWDLAVTTWSLTWNCGPGWEDAFLAAYGVPRDPAKIAFYRLLYNLLP